jgi:hypothetical protein
MLESLNLPTIYSRGQESEYFNQWTYWKNILLATVYGIVSMLIVYCVMEGGVVDPVRPRQLSFRKRHDSLFQYGSGGQCQGAADESRPHTHPSGTLSF